MGLFMRAKLKAVRKISEMMMNSPRISAVEREKFRNFHRLSELYLKGKDLTREEMNEILDFIDKQSKRER